MQDKLAASSTNLLVKFCEGCSTVEVASLMQVHSSSKHESLNDLQFDVCDLFFCMSFTYMGDGNIFHAELR